MRWLLVAVFVFGCSAGKSESRAVHGETCKGDDKCESGLVCVDGIEVLPICVHLCGRDGYGGCPDGWQCGGEAVMSFYDVDGRKICVPGDWSLHPSGWWVASKVDPPPAGEDDIGPDTAFRFAKDGYDLVLPSGTYDRRLVQWGSKGKSGWSARGRYKIDLGLVGDTLVLSHRGGSVIMAAASSERIAAAEAALQGAPTVPAMCKRALECCNKASAALEQSCDAGVELGDGRWLNQCRRTIDGFRAELANAKAKPIEACAAVGAKPAPAAKPKK